MSPRLHLSIPKGAAPGERRFGITNLTKVELILLDGAILIAVEQIRRDADLADQLRQPEVARDLRERRADLQKLYRVIRDAQAIAP